MATIWITSSFLNNGAPETGLIPLITVYDLIDDSVVISSGSMSEVANGIYKYLFSTYDETKNYAIYVDGGATLDSPDRYQYFGGAWLSPSETWEYSNRTLTSASGLGLASGSSVDNITGTSASTIWEYTTRTITSASGLGLASGSSVENIVGISASTIWDYNTRTLTNETIISASTIAYAVWEELLVGHTVTGTAGSALILSRDILNTTIDGIYTLEDVIKIMVSVLAGKLTGGGTDTLTFRNLSDTLNRVIVTVNQVAERTGVTIQV
jgi:hypothetical protein